tara:strand:- start:1118 stop:1849 length:732 start_codon:yes stop_codon:yes gene_type:complete
VNGLLQDRVALITGSSRGIGKALAIRFAKEGAHVILVARSRGGLEETDDEIKKATDNQAKVTLLELDISKFKQVDMLGPTLSERFSCLDILIGNAGQLGELAPLAHIDDKIWANTIDTNLNANWHLIRTTEPLLRLSTAGRALFVTSAAGQLERPFWGAYAASKAGLEMMVKCWAEEIKNTNVKVNLIDPGKTRTAMRAQAYPGENPNDLKEPKMLTDLFVALCDKESSIHGEVIRADEKNNL